MNLEKVAKELFGLGSIFIGILLTAVLMLTLPVWFIPATLYLLWKNKWQIPKNWRDYLP